jgi:PAS domain S-box-containing protein
MVEIEPKPPLSTVLETALDAVVVMDRDGRIIDWNATAVEIFGWTRGEAVGAVLGALIIPPELREAHNRGLKRFLETGVGPVLRKRIEVMALRKSGQEFPVELSITPYEETGGLVFLGFLRDITERKHAAVRLEQQARQAKVLYDAISFAAGATSPEQALEICLGAVHELTGWPLGHVYIPSETDPALLDPSGIWFPATGDLYLEFKEATAGTRFSVGKGLPGLVWQTGEPVWAADVRTDTRFPRAPTMERVGIRSAVGFPIKNGGATIAVVEFFTPVRSQPDPNLLLILRSIGDQVGRVFERRLAETKLKKETERQKLLLAELNHRVKNMLTVVTGIAAQTMRHSDSVEAFNKDFLSRLHALSEAHGLLATQSWGRTPLDLLAGRVLAPYEGASSRIELGGPHIDLAPKTALALSMVLHELVTNAAKYGALSDKQGRLSIQWKLDQQASNVHLNWSEYGLTGLSKPSRTGFGTRLINATIKHELHGNFDVAYQPDGIRYSMDWPVESGVKGGLDEFR